MAEITNELMYEVLKPLQAGISDIKMTLADHTRQFLRVREDINSLRDDINNLRRETCAMSRCKSRSTPDLSASKHA